MLKHVFLFLILILLACDSEFKVNPKVALSSLPPTAFPILPGPPTPPGPTNSWVCIDLYNYMGGGVDASDALQRCIDQTQPGSIVEFPPGLYRVSKQVRIRTNITVRTQGKTTANPACSYQSPHDCAELIAAPDFLSTFGLIFIETQAQATLDHIVINGNKQARQSSESAYHCTHDVNHYGYNMQVDCSNCTVSNIVSKNALCGTAFGTGTGSNVNIFRNFIVFNGYHNTNLLWADGMTFNMLQNAVITDNILIDNSDVDFILNGCRNCRIQNNRVIHTESFAGSSFAAMMLNWPGDQAGDYTGSDISGNAIDCGPQRNCGFGLYIGADAWASPPNLQIFGGAVHDNTITGAQQGFAVDRTTGVMEVYNNYVTNSGGSFKTACGRRDTTAYSIDSDSILDRSKDTVPSSSYANINWNGCIPNWWQ